ncbi:MAG: hypothetical protein COB98_04675 [Flavobacteriaceae bacterium]|nr:MAG: hypothetical protein COB98_04675 [Flavobacteriaceae bacterium]
MKKYTIIIVLFIGSIVQAQQELKLDLLDALALKTVEVSYEKYISNQSSIGLSVLFNLEKKSSDFRYNEERMLSPFFRHYFSRNGAWNMFGEVFFGLNSGEKELKAETESKEKQYQSYTDGALGLAIGSKYISETGFVVDIYGGLGRNLFSDDSPVVVPRVGINIGYRF